jgi:hypothetical protein
MATEITNNGSSLKILLDGSPRFILKNQIKEVEVVRDTIIKIDIGQGALYNVFIDQADVTNPASTSVDDLRDQIIAMLQTSVAAGLATQELQTAEINQIKALQTSVSGLNDKVTSLDNKLFYQPALIDESNANYVFEGYATPGQKTSDPVWAILKVANIKGVLSYQWASGNKNFDKIWDNRKTLIYS